MEVVLDDNGRLEYVKTNIGKPTSTNAQNLSQWKKYVAKAMRIVLERMREENRVDSQAHAMY